MRNFTLTLLSIFLCVAAVSQSTTRIITDFGGYWSSTTASPNPLLPDTSHMLLGFTFDGVTYSTGVNDAILTNRGVTYTPADFRAFPVSGIAGTYGSGAGGGIACYITMARKNDGLPNAANVPAVADYNIRNALIDGIHGLDLGTGVTNLPTSAEMNFRIYNIDATKINDNEPDIILTQIADPTAAQNDVYTLRDINGNQVGNAYSQVMNTVPSFGTYALDLYSLTPNTPYNAATVYSITAAQTNSTRPIRVVALKLSVFGIDASNEGQVVSLKIAPSGISDYAFIAYNTRSILLSPNVSQNPPLTNTTLCDDGTAHFSVVATAANGGVLSYIWEESTDGGNSWNAVIDGGNYAGATTSRLSVTDPTNATRYRVTVTEANNPNPVTSELFEVNIIPNPTAPSNITIAGGGTVCRGTPIQLTSTVTGGSNLYYQWESDPTGTTNFQAIPGANLSTYVPPVDQTGTMNYRLRVSSGSACIPSLTSPVQVITTDGISSFSGDERCGPGTVTLTAAATSGTINWYTQDIGSTAVTSGTTYSPNLSSSTTYYVSTSTCASSPRVPVRAIINPVSAGGTITGGDVIVTPGNNATTLTLTGNTGNVVKWQSSTDNFASNIVDIANSSSQLTVTNITQTTQYRALVQSGTCPAAFSAATTITTGTLPIQVGSLKAIPEGNTIRVQWIGYNQYNTLEFEIEKSVDGVNFVKAGTVASNGSSDDAQYHWLDASPAPGKNFYRIKEVFRSGTFDYSAIVNAAFKTGGTGIAVYPNPVINNNFTLAFTNMPAGRYQVNYINNNGQIVHQESLNHNGGYYTHSLKVPAGIKPGVYGLMVTGTQGNTKTSVSVVIR